MTNTYNKRQVIVNSIMSMIQVIVTGLSFFILYKVILDTIGPAKLGIWSLVLVVATLISITDLGFSGGVIKFVAKYHARGEEENVSGIIQTSAITIGIFMGIILLALKPLIVRVLAMTVPAANLQDAVSILPYALLSLWLTVITAVFQSAIDGYQRIDVRNAVAVAGVLVGFALSFVLVIRRGLMGLAYAQVASSIILLIANWVVIKRFALPLPLIPFQWNLRLFKEMVGYGVNLQIISFCRIIYDPLTKILLVKFGNLNMVAFYEMASRMVLQVRALFITAYQVLISTIADLNERNPAIIENIYRKSFGLMLYISLPIFSSVIVLAPVASHIWLGRYDATFIIFTRLLSLGWFLNTLAAPAYIVSLGIGELKWNTAGHLIIAILNLILGILFGSLFDGIGVVVAWIIALSAGSLTILLDYHRRYHIYTGVILIKENVFIILASMGSVFVSSLFYYRFGPNFNVLTIMISIFFILFFSFIIPLWRHPMRNNLSRWLSENLLKAL